MNVKHHIIFALEIALMAALCIVAWKFLSSGMRTRRESTRTAKGVDGNSKVVSSQNLLENGNFVRGRETWLYRPDATSVTNSVMFTGACVQLHNPAGRMVGIQQTVAVQSGAVYRLSGKARSIYTNDSTIGFGARIACYIPGQREFDMVWMTEHTTWWARTVLFTNLVTGTATVYLHMGFGAYASSGQFTDIKLEQIPR